jgi:hypothetical protein
LFARLGNNDSFKAGRRGGEKGEPIMALLSEQKKKEERRELSGGSLL